MDYKKMARMAAIPLVLSGLTCMDAALRRYSGQITSPYHQGLSDVRILEDKNHDGQIDRVVVARPGFHGTAYINTDNPTEQEIEWYKEYFKSR